MTPRYHRMIGIVLVVIAFVATGFIALNIDGPYPVHWNADGQVDRTADSAWGLFILPLTMLAMLVLFQVIGRISPKGFKLDSFTRVVGIAQNAILFFLAFVLAVQLLIIGGIEVPMDKAVMVGTGILLAVIGNFLGKTRKNFFIGVRTPWTLASDEVWYRTHRLAGWLFVIGGVLIALLALFISKPIYLVAVALVMAVVPVAYSYFCYRQRIGFNGEA